MRHAPRRDARRHARPLPRGRHGRATAAWPSAAATRSSSRASSARPPTSWRRTTCAPGRGSSAPPCAAHHDGPGEVVFASKAFPCTAVLRVFAEEGLGCDVASGGELHLALRAGFAPERIYLHGNAKSEAELRMAVEAGVGWIVLDNADDVAKLERVMPAGARRRVLLRVTPGRGGRDARGHPHRPRGVQVRLRAGRGRRARRPARPTTSTSAASTSTSAPSSSTWSRTARRWRRSPRSPTCRSTPSAAGWPCPTRPRTARPGPEASVAAMAEAARDAARAGQAPRDRAGALAGGQRGRDALHGAVGQAAAARAGRRGGRRRHVRQPAARCSTTPSTRWRWPTGSTSPGSRPRWWASTASRATCSWRTRCCRRCAPGDVLVTPVTGAYGHAMANNYNGVPRPPVVFCAGGAARLVVRRETYEELHARDV